MSAAKLTAAALAILVIAAGPALGQGRSSAPGQNKDSKDKSAAKTTTTGSESKARTPSSGIASPTTATSETSAPAASANAVAYYGSWLDDASIVEPGDVWVGIATGYWRGDSNRQFDVPVASVAVGLTPRFQAGGSLSFYHFRAADGGTENGFGNYSFYGKYQVLDPYRAPNAIGVAVTPLVEVAPGSGAPLGWALPVNIEAHRNNVRMYGSAGFFSRGSIFATAAADVPVTSRVSVGANFGRSFSRSATHQTSIGAGVSIGLSAASGLYVGLGRTFAPPASGPGGTSLAGGVSVLLPQHKRP